MIPKAEIEAKATHREVMWKGCCSMSRILRSRVPFNSSSPAQLQLMLCSPSDTSSTLGLWWCMQLPIWCQMRQTSCQTNNTSQSVCIHHAGLTSLRRPQWEPVRWGQDVGQYHLPGSFTRTFRQRFSHIVEKPSQVNPERLQEAYFTH